ncbi:MAG: hypothetical protein HOG49_12940 [Candidatus Scalindua sp.]|nr:hypothetical protein [Candidatus Scalindua sp.]
MWTRQGGMATIASYVSAPLEWRTKHLHYLRNKTVFYHIDDENKIYVHGGFDQKVPIRDQDPYNLYWNRHIIEVAKIYVTQKREFKDYKEVFVGHTTTGMFGTDKPLNISNLWMLDTGSGWEGKLTIMDVNTHEYWQSDLSEDLYPNDYHGRER